MKIVAGRNQKRRSRECCRRWKARDTWRWMTPAERERALNFGERLSMFEPPLAKCPRCGHWCAP